MAPVVSELYEGNGRCVTRVSAPVRLGDVTRDFPHFPPWLRVWMELPHAVTSLRKKAQSTYMYLYKLLVIVLSETVTCRQILVKSFVNKFHENRFGYLIFTCGQ